MLRFFIKKNFCDGWDNIFSIFISNFVIMVVSIGLASIISIIAKNNIFAFGLIGIIIIAVCVFVVAYGTISADIADFRSVYIKDFFLAIPASIKDGIFLGILISASVAAFAVGIPFYMAQQSFFAFILAAMMIWLALIEIVILQWFVAVRSILRNDFIKCIKKCFIITFDNLGFSLFMLAYDILSIVISFFALGLVPSFAGITLGKVNALRLLLYKYDYLENHPELKTARERRNIPWKELIKDDEETLGPRTLKSFIFPWK